MKKLLILLGAMLLISQAEARSRSAGYSGSSRNHSYYSRPSGINPATGRPRGFFVPRQQFSSGRMAGASTQTPQAPTATYPGIPPVAGALIRDPSMFVKQTPTGEGERYYGPSAGGLLVASDDSKAQALTNAPGAFTGRPDCQVPSQCAGGSGSGGGIGTFYQNLGK